MLFHTLAKLGYDENDVLKRFDELGGATPENIAKIIAENNRLLVNQINTVIQGNNEEIRNALKK